QLNREIHYRYGVDAVIIRDDRGVGTYVSKIHLELVRSDLKQTRGGKGRTPWQVGVDAAETGDARDIARWKEWVTVSRRRRAISVSPAVRAAYPAHETAELSDEELAQQEQNGEIELDFDNEVYDTLLHHRHQPLRALVALAFEDNGSQGVLNLLHSILDRAVYLGGPEPGNTAPVIRYVSAQALQPLQHRPRTRQ
ncbi:MAG: hypothetical protein GY925_25190, partial [Actinomycetia bacterium]|nr:hypothetical protein [Actinomycetes bacterium]